MIVPCSDYFGNAELLSVLPGVRIFLGKVFKSVNLNTLIAHVYATRKLVYL